MILITNVIVTLQNIFSLTSALVSLPMRHLLSLFLSNQITMMVIRKQASPIIIL